MIYKVKEVKNEVDLNMLRKGVCPWCLQKLSPIFDGDKHVADACLECGDRFE